MIKALLLIVAPVRTWEGIFRAQRGFFFILGAYLLPLMIMTSAWEGYGLVRFGKFQGEVSHLIKFKPGEAVVFEVMQFALSLILVIFNAGLVKSVCGTFQVHRHNYMQGFRTIAYGMGPFFLFRLLDGFAEISPWISWLFGILLTISVLYHGVPKVMQPDPAHAFGLYVVTSLLLLFTTGLMQLLTAFCLQGKAPRLMTIISDLGAKLPL